MADIEFNANEPITLSITIFDGDGNVVEYAEYAQRPEDVLSQSEVDEAVRLIEHGMTAYDAVFVAKQMRDCPIIEI